MNVYRNLVDFETISTIFHQSAGQYQTASPFPHISTTGLFSPSTLQAVANEFPKAEQMGGSFRGEIEGGKFTESDFSKFGPFTQAFVAACNSGPFLTSLSTLTGIPNLIADPYLAGGGQHQTGRGGRLKVHSDFNVHPFLHLTRRLNMLVYLNDPWEESWGGALELWDKDMTQVEVSIPPLLGQVGIFTCSDTSFHGLPDPLNCPAGTFRRSLAFYYFTADAERPQSRSTLWKERPSEDFLSRPTARLKRSAGLARQSVRALFDRQAN